jgi:hypothetical protein
LGYGAAIGYTCCGLFHSEAMPLSPDGLDCLQEEFEAVLASRIKGLQLAQLRLSNPPVLPSSSGSSGRADNNNLGSDGDDPPGNPSPTQRETVLANGRPALKV